MSLTILCFSVAGTTPTLFKLADVNNSRRCKMAVRQLLRHVGSGVQSTLVWIVSKDRYEYRSGLQANVRGFYRIQSGSVFKRS